MKKSLILLSVFTGICFFTNGVNAAELEKPTPAQTYLAKRVLAGRIPEDDRRYESFVLTLEMLQQRNCKVMVETGTARCGEKDVGAGASTILFGDWAFHNGAKFTSVDISPANLAVAKRDSHAYVSAMDFVVSDSVKFLENFKDKIDFLYLDSLDYEIDNPTPSQEHHLKELIASYPKLHKNTFILIDDCGLPKGGKGKLAIEYLTSKGWKVVYNKYQVLLVQ